ncbi:MAG: zf-HC2 domain-containing protein [Candidatus Binatia bacterium]
MADARYLISESKSAEVGSCPEFEDLSRFVDGELSPRESADVEVHLKRCAWCSGLTKMISAWFDAAAAASAEERGDARCTTTELLVGYLTTGLTASERRDIDRHVRGCDQCIRTLTLLQRRLLSAPEMAAPVPAAVVERARAASTRDVGHARPAVGLGEAWAALSSVGRRLSAHIKLPVLVPAAVAAAALLVVATEQTWVTPAPQRELTRAVPMHQTLRVTAQEAIVRNQPSTRTQIVGTLQHGTTIEIAGQERDWYRVTLPDGTEGWVERRAFE